MKHNIQTYQALINCTRTSFADFWASGTLPHAGTGSAIINSPPVVNKFSFFVNGWRLKELFFVQFDHSACANFVWKRQWGGARQALDASMQCGRYDLPFSIDRTATGFLIIYIAAASLLDSN